MERDDTYQKLFDAQHKKDEAKIDQLFADMPERIPELKKFVRGEDVSDEFAKWLGGNEIALKRIDEIIDNQPVMEHLMDIAHTDEPVAPPKENK